MAGGDDASLPSEEMVPMGSDDDIVLSETDRICLSTPGSKAPEPASGCKSC
jgi:hypothetical protein